MKSGHFQVAAFLCRIASLSAGRRTPRSAREREAEFQEATKANTGPSYFSSAMNNHRRFNSSWKKLFREAAVSAS
jgi:hypothetical protein